MTTETDIRRRMVKTAAAWAGRRQADGSHRVIIDTYNAHTPLPRGYRVSYTDSWCAAFISAVAMLAGCAAVFPVECSCSRQIQMLRAWGRWEERDSYVPAPGDLIYYAWSDHGSGDNRSLPDHVGLVTAVDTSRAPARITAIEGNKGGGYVGYRHVKVDGRYIRGFGRPDYASVAAAEDRAKKEAEEREARCTEATVHLANAGIIDSPAYWALAASKYPAVGELLIKSAAQLHTAGPRLQDAGEGIAALHNAGIIDSPDYWHTVVQAGTIPAIMELFRALGGAAMMPSSAVPQEVV